MNGAKLMFSRDERYRTGDFVLLHKRPEFVAPGEHQMIVKRLVVSTVTREYWQPGWIITPDSSRPSSWRC